MKRSRRREIVQIVIGYLGTLLGLCGLIAFQRHVLIALPLAVRMVSTILMYWVIAIVPVIVMILSKDTLADYGFTKQKIAAQIVIGVVVGVVFSALFTLLPHLLGWGEFVDNGTRYHAAWQFIYEFVYCILAVGLSEEFLFRGFFYTKIKRVSNDTVAMIGSSVLFGVLHLFSGSWIQMIVTALLGVLFCLCKRKIKNCSTLSLGVAHGVYDALITVLVAVFC